jgi:hypothetical protein
LTVVILSLVIIAAQTTQAKGSLKKIGQQLDGAAIEEFGHHNGPAYLLISTGSPTFEIPVLPENLNGSIRNSLDEMGSLVWRVRTGDMIAGDVIETTLFQGANVVEVDSQPIENGNAATFVGGFITRSDEIPHVATPTPDEINTIPFDVQDAYVNASRMFDEAEANLTLPNPCTTAQLGVFIKDFGGPGGTESPANVNDIMNHLFVHDMSMACASPCTAEGNLFGHEPTEGLLFFKLELGEEQNGKVALRLAIGRVMQAKFKAINNDNPLNLGSNGQQPFAILSEKDSDGSILFDAPGQIDTDTIRAVAFDSAGFELAELSVIRSKVAEEDLNNDGCPDLRVHFDTQALVPLIEYEQDLTFKIMANTAAEGMQLRGFDTFRVVPAK